MEVWEAVLKRTGYVCPQHWNFHHFNERKYISFLNRNPRRALLCILHSFAFLSLYKAEIFRVFFPCCHRGERIGILSLKQ